MPSVLLTRPQTTSAHLAKELQRLGYTSIIEPLLTIEPTSAPCPDLAEIKACIITSANAITALEEGDYPLDELLQLPCFCVGPRTADKARAYGFRKTFVSDNDGLALAQLVCETLPSKNHHILHIAGRDTDGKMQADLLTNGFQMSVWPIYAAEPATQFTAATIEAIKQKKLDAVLVFSARTAMTLQKLVERHDLKNACQNLIAIGLSVAVADVLKTMAWQRVMVSSHPTEDAVIQCLKEILPVS